MSNNKNILGRGLSAIFNEIEGQNSLEDNIVAIEVPLQQIIPNPNQPRKFFDNAEMDELVASIEKEGVLQPILIRKTLQIDSNQPEYQIIAGERRWRAATKLNLDTIPAIVIECDDQTALQLSLVENMQRHNLSPLEEAQSMKTLMDEFHKTQEEIAVMLSKSRSYVANMVRLLRLPEPVQTMLQKKEISAGHARAILDADDPEAVAKDIIENKLSVRDIENKMKKHAPHNSIKREKSIPNEDIALLEKSISEYFKMNVKIITRSTGGGSIQIYFNDYNDLDVFLEKITGI